MLGWLRRKTEDLFGAPRSGKWPAHRAAHLRREPSCQACGRAKELEVHHILPVNAGGDELPPPAGMITLCRDCHYTVGHACDWRAWRPDVRRLATTLREAEVKRAN